MIPKKKSSSDDSSEDRDADSLSKRLEERSDYSQDDAKDSASKRQNKCITSYQGKGKKKIKKKQMKSHAKEVVRFVEGYQCQEGRGIKKASIKQNGKTPRYCTEVKFLDHKYIQCNIAKADGEVEISLPEEIKSLLINVTFLLHELKPKNLELSSVISKISTFLTELSKRPIKRYDQRNDYAKQFEEVAEKLGSVLRERNGPDEQGYEKLANEVKYLKQELTEKDSEVNYVREQIRDEQSRLMPAPRTIDDLIRNSILRNHSLKAEIKYNKIQLRKYSKILAEKEQTKQKSLIQLGNLKRKYAKFEVNPQYRAKPSVFDSSHNELDVFHGGSVTKYIRSKVAKKKKDYGKTF